MIQSNYKDILRNDKSLVSKRTIILLVVITLVLVAIAFSGKESTKQVENVWVSDSSEEIKENEDPPAGPYRLSSGSETIYVIISAKKLETSDSIKVTWSSNDTEPEVIQETTISPSKEGSGKISLSLIKKDGSYPEGDYFIKVYLNGTDTGKKVSFELF